jgi:hypothetical protein
MKLDTTLIFSDGQSPSKATLNPRQAVLADLETVVALCREFHSISLWSSIPFDEDHVTKLAANTIATGGVFLVDGGLIAGLVTGTVFAPDVLMAAEIIWYAPNGGGQELRTAFEAWAVSQGATVSQLTHPVNENLKDFTARMVDRSYHPFELSFVKAI